MGTDWNGRIPRPDPDRLAERVARRFEEERPLDPPSRVATAVRLANAVADALLALADSGAAEPGSDDPMVRLGHSPLFQRHAESESLDAFLPRFKLIERVLSEQLLRPLPPPERPAAAEWVRARVERLLSAMIDEWVRRRDESKREEEEEEAAGLALDLSHRPVFDPGRVLTRFDGDVDLLKSVSERFLEETPFRIGRLREAVRAGDHREALRLAHSLKVAAQSIGLSRFQTMAEHMELAARAGNGDLLARTLETIGPAFAELARILPCFDWVGVAAHYAMQREV